MLFCGWWDLTVGNMGFSQHLISPWQALYWVLSLRLNSFFNLHQIGACLCVPHCLEFQYKVDSGKHFLHSFFSMSFQFALLKVLSMTFNLILLCLMLAAFILRYSLKVLLQNHSCHLTLYSRKNYPIPSIQL